jgi:hypothetical protein
MCSCVLSSTKFKCFKDVKVGTMLNRSQKIDNSQKKRIETTKTLVVFFFVLKTNGSKLACNIVLPDKFYAKHSSSSWAHWRSYVEAILGHGPPLATCNL